MHRQLQVCTGVLFAILLLFISPANMSSSCSGDVQADIVFVLDSSGSVGASNFQTMLAFVQDLVNDLEIGSDKVRVGVQTFMRYVNTEFNLNTYYDKTSIVNAIGKIVYTKGDTNTGGALDHLRTNMFTSGNGDRANVPNIGIVMSDGESNDASYTADAAAAARNAGITLFSIGIGSDIPLSELNEIATDPDSDHVFAVSGFSALSSIKSTFQKQACSAVAGNWGSWTSWTNCSEICEAIGNQTRTRNCDNSTSANNGLDCVGNSTEIMTCDMTLIDCYLDGNWTSWTSWDNCTVTCGTGSQFRERNCTNPIPKGGGNDCPGAANETQSCTLAVTCVDPVLIAGASVAGLAALAAVTAYCCFFQAGKKIFGNNKEEEEEELPEYVTSARGVGVGGLETPASGPRFAPMGTGVRRVAPTPYPASYPASLRF